MAGVDNCTVSFFWGVGGFERNGNFFAGFKSLRRVGRSRHIGRLSRSAGSPGLYA